MKLGDQFRQNQLAIISLIVALTALGYNTWRNELSEHNRTVRAAGFEMLIHIGELQRVSYLRHYDKDLSEGNPRKGWTEVLLLRDLALLLPQKTQVQADKLYEAWQSNWEQLGSDQQAIDAIETSLTALRESVQDCLIGLD